MTMDKGRNLLAILLMTALAPVWTAAQQVPTKHFMTPDGLPHQQCRKISIDNDEFVWISTLGGVGLYDGQQVRHLTNCPDLNQENIHYVRAWGSDIWASTIHTLLRCTGDTLFSYTFSNLESFQQFGNTFLSPGQPLAVENCAESHYLLFDTEQQSTVGISPNDKWLYSGTYQKRIQPYGEVADSGTYSVFAYPPILKRYKNLESDESSKGFIFKSTLDGYVFKLDPLQKVHKIFKIKQDSLLEVAKLDTSTGMIRILSPFAPKMIYERKPKEGKINLLFKQGLFYSKVPFERSLPSPYITELEDRALVPTDEGLLVFFFSGLSTLRMKNCVYPWSVFRRDSQLCVTCYREGIFTLTPEGEGEKTHPLPIASSQLKYRSPWIHSNTATDGELNLFGSYIGFLRLSKEGSLDIIQTPAGVGSESFDYREEDSLFYLGADALYTWDKKEKNPRLLPGSKDAVEKIFPVHDIAVIGNTVWAGGQMGLLRYCLRDSVAKKIYDRREMPCKTAVTLLQFGEDLLIGSSCGLLRYDSRTDRFTQILEEVLNKRINQLVLSSDSLLIAVASDQISIIDLKIQPWDLIYQLDDDSGVETHEPSENGAYIADDRLVYIPHSQGVQVLDLDFVRSLEKKDSAQRMPYVMVTTNNSEFFHLSEQPIRLSGNSASFTPLLWQEYGKKWEYRFIRNNSSPSPWTVNNLLFIDNLSHGRNTITLQARTFGQPLVERRIKVYAVQPFWDRQIVRQVLAACLIVLLITFGLLRYRYLLKERRFSYDLAINKLRTIQTFFNPHFLLNALTSLQYSILNKTKDESNELLVSLSRTFHSLIYEQKESKSPLKFITLSRELQLIKDIAFLFNAQHHPRHVTLDIKLDSRINPETTQVPQLLVEPFVENAYKHAFSKGNSEAPVVMLDIRKEDDDLVFTITDNGSGFSMGSRKIRQSQSMKLAHERIRLLNTIKKHCTLDIQSSEGKGTSVAIRYRAESQRV